MKTVYIIITTIALNFSCFGSHSCKFETFEITQEDSISEFQKILAGKFGQLSERDADKIRAISSFSKERIVAIKDGAVCIEDMHPIQYAEKQADHYVLVNDNKEEGIYCKMTVKKRDFLSYLLEGEVQFYAVSQRKPFEPFPEVHVGTPIRMTGGEYNGVVRVSKNGYAVVSAAVHSKKNQKKRALVLLVTIIGTDNGKDITPSKGVISPEWKWGGKG